MVTTTTSSPALTNGQSSVPASTTPAPLSGALYSFNDPLYFQEKIKEKGLTGVTQEVVEVVNALFPETEIIYEELLDGTSPILDILPSIDQSLGPSGRRQNDEQILTLFTDVEDYGKYDKIPVVDEETSKQKIDPNEFRQSFSGIEGPSRQAFVEPSPRLDAFKAGARKAVIPAAFSVPGAVAGARTAAQASAVPAAYTGPYAPLVVGGAAVVGGFIGGGGAAYLGSLIDDFIFDTEDPILLPSLQSSYNAGETFTYGISTLATPAAAAKIPIKPVVESFQGLKFLENFKGVASGKFDPKVMDEALIRSLGRKEFERAMRLRDRPAPTTRIGKLKEKVTLDATKGPIKARLPTAIAEGVAKGLTEAGKNPKAFIGLEALMSSAAATGAYLAEEIAPGNVLARLGFELGTAGLTPIATKTGKVLFGSLLDYGRRAIAVAKNPQDAAETFIGDKTGKQAASRLFEFIFTHPDFPTSGTPEEEIAALRKILLDPSIELPDDIVATASAQVKDTPFSPILKELDRQLSASSDALAMASDAGKEQFIAEAKRKIEALALVDHPEALTMASIIQQGLMEQQLVNNMELAVNTLENSLRRIYPDITNLDEIPQDKANEIAPKLYELLEKQIAGFKKREGQLWDEVPNFTIAGPFNKQDGSSSGVPAMVEIFNLSANKGGLNFGGVRGSKAEFESALGDYKADIDDIVDFFTGATNQDGSLKVTVNPLDLETFQSIRSALKKKTRSMMSGVVPNAQGGEFLGRLVRAMDEDLYSLDPQTQYGLLAPEDTQLTRAGRKAYLDAKAFSFAGANVFKRTLLGQMTRTTGDGAGLIDASDALNLLKKGSRIEAQRVEQIMRAAQEFDDSFAPGVMDRKAFKEIGFEEKFEGVETVDFTDFAGRQQQNVPFNAAQQEKELGETVLQAIRNFNREFVNQTTDPVTGEVVSRTVDAKKLETFKNSERAQRLFSTFPQLKEDLSSLEKAQQLINAASVDNNVLKNTPENVAFRLFLKRPESTATTMSQILSGTSSEGVSIPPARTLQKMVDNIKQLGDVVDPETGVSYTTKQVLDGFRASLINAAALKSGNFGTKFNAKAFQSYLFDPLKSVDLSLDFKLIDFMKKNDLVNDQYEKNLQQMIKTINSVDEAFETGDLSPILFKKGSVAKLGALKIAGALAVGTALERFKGLIKSIPGFGNVIQGDLVGAGVVAGGVGAEAAPRLFITGPETLVVQEMVRIMENPKALAAALRETTDDNQFGKSVSTVNQLLGETLIRRSPMFVKELPPVIEEEVREERPATTIVPLPDPQASLQPVPQFMDRESRQLQGAGTPPTMSPPPAAPAPAPSGPVDRSRYAALFPADITSSLIRAQDQGIGSLGG
jgi:hypothetical protein